MFDCNEFQERQNKKPSSMFLLFFILEQKRYLLKQQVNNNTKTTIFSLKLTVQPHLVTTCKDQLSIYHENVWDCIVIKDDHLKLNIFYFILPRHKGLICNIK